MPNKGFRLLYDYLSMWIEGRAADLP